MESRRKELTLVATSPRQNVGDVKQPPKAATIYPMQRAMTVKKADSVKRVAHEPVKGAVFPISQTIPSASTGIAKSLLQTNLNRAPSIGSLNSAQSAMGIQEFSRTEHVTGMCRAPVRSGVDVTLLSDEAASFNHLAQGILKNSFKSETLNSATGTHSDSDGSMSAQLTSLKEQLEVQTKVNSDLKKLLVASIGDDLHYKVDALVRTKVQLANEIDDYTRKLVEDYEDLDKVSIQADLFHSKYQACRVLADQLTAERDKLSTICCQSTSALQHLLTERQHLQQQQRYLNRGLLALHNMFSSSSSSAVHTAVTCDGDNMALAGANNWLINDLCYSLLGTRPSLIATQNRPSSNTMTHSEQQAYQVLVDANKELPNNSGNLAATNQMHPLPRFHLGARYDGFTISCCRHCKGEIYVV